MAAIGWPRRRPRSRCNCCCPCLPAASWAARYSDCPQPGILITLDMGGTSCDIAVISDGEQRYAMQFDVEFGLPLTLPTIDVTTIGAGGGSVAWIDGGGSCGSDPAAQAPFPVLPAIRKAAMNPLLRMPILLWVVSTLTIFWAARVSLDRSRASTAVARLGRTAGTGFGRDGPRHRRNCQ